MYIPDMDPTTISALTTAAGIAVRVGWALVTSRRDRPEVELTRRLGLLLIAVPESQRAAAIRTWADLERARRGLR